MIDAGPPDVALVAPAAGHDRVVIDLMPQTRPNVPECETSTDDEIVVCNRIEEQEQFRLRPLDPRFAELDDEGRRLRTTIGGAEVYADTEAATLAGGVTSQRVMVRAKIKF